MTKEPEIIITRDGITVRSGDDQTTAKAGDIDKVLKNVFAPSGIFMPAVRWISQGGHAAIMERPPFVARVAYRPAQAQAIAENDASHYNLPVPWQVYGVIFNPDFTEVESLYVFVRNAPMLDETSTLHMFPYPNVFNTSIACMGPQFQANFAKANTPTLSHAIAGVLTAFWQADFNEDAGENTWYAPWRAPMLSLPEDWREMINGMMVQPYKLLRWYSETTLENFRQFQFPCVNTLDPSGDTVAQLIRKLSADETVSLSSVGGVYDALRLAHAKAGRGSKKKHLAF